MKMTDIQDKIAKTIYNLQAILSDMEKKPLEKRGRKKGFKMSASHKRKIAEARRRFWAKRKKRG